MTGIELFTIGAGAPLGAAVAGPTLGTAVTLGHVLTAAGIGAGVAGAVGQGQAGRQQAEFQAETMRQQAERERQQAALNEEDFRRSASRVAASRRAAMGASGVDSGSGSPLLTSEDFAGETELQALRMRNGGQVNADRLDQSAGMQKIAGRNAQRSGFTRGGALLLSGAGKAFS